jgi:hypothetical protein
MRGLTWRECTEPCGARPTFLIFLPMFSLIIRLQASSFNYLDVDKSGHSGHTNTRWHSAILLPPVQVAPPVKSLRPRSHLAFSRVESRSRAVRPRSRFHRHYLTNVHDRPDVI